MEHKGTVTIETERLILRRFTEADAEPMFRNWANDPDVAKYLTWLPHGELCVTQTLLSSWIRDYEKADSYNWVIVLKAEGEPVGSISGVEIREDTDCISVGYCLAKRCWHQGIMSEALNAVIRFWFTEVKANRIEAYHAVQNPHSGGVMQKCGMQYEGTQRQAHRFTNGQLYDSCGYAILAEDWNG